MLQRFLGDEETIAILSKPSKPFDRPSAGSRSNYDTKTAPIHVSQASSSDYDLEQIKKDALWLSERLDGEETWCLRVAILEWQQRPKDCLLAAPEKAGVKPPVGLRTSFLASTASFGGSTMSSAVSPALDFSREETRHERQIRIHNEERSCSMKLTADLISYCAAYGAANLRRSSSWLDALAVKITEQFCAPALGHEENADSMVHHIDWIDETLGMMNDRIKWPKAFTEGDNLAIEDDFSSTALVNTTSMLRIILAQLYSLEGPPSGRPVLRWFNTMKRERYEHMQGLRPTLQLRDVSAIQALGSAVSLAMLAPGLSIPIIQESASESRGSDVSYPQLPGQAPYFTYDDTVKELHQLILQTVADGYDLALPAVYAWALIVRAIRDIAIPLSLSRQDEGSSDTEVGEQRRSVRASQRETQLERQWELLQREMPANLPSEAQTDPAVFMLEAVVDAAYGLLPALGTVLGNAYCSGDSGLDQTSLVAREQLCLLLKEGFEVVGYSSEVLEAFFAIMRSSTNSTGPEDRNDSLPNLLASEGMSYLLEQATLRYPFELSPFLRVLTMTARADSELTAGPANVIRLMEEFKSVTVMVPLHFRNFRLENEEANTNEMVLTDTLPLFVAKQKAMSFEGEQRLLVDRAMRGSQNADENVILLPAGTSGNIMREDKPIVLMLEHKHSGLEYLGLLLSTLLPTSEFIPAPPASVLDRSTAGEIVTLLNALQLASLRQDQGVDEAKVVLGRFSNALPNEQDIITIISEIFEMELLSFLDQSAQEGSLDLLIACAEFWSILVDISPERLWSLLNRSSLLGAASGAPSALAAVVGGAEVHVSSFRFLEACTTLYQHLVDDAIAGLIKRKPREEPISSRAVARRRFDSPFADQLSATPERALKDVMTAWQRVMLDAYQSLASWRFAETEEKQRMTCSMMASFESIVKMVYGLEAPVSSPLNEIDEKKPARQMLGDLLKPAADMIIEAFAPAEGATSLADTFAGLLRDGLTLAEDLLPMKQIRMLQSQIGMNCRFLAGLIRTARTRAAPNGAVGLAKELAKCMPTLAKLVALEPAIKRDSTELLYEIVETFTASDTDTPSLLAYLGPDAANSFLQVITQLERPLLSYVGTEISLWNLFTAVLESTRSAGGQAAFAMYLLTGNLPNTNRDPRASTHDSRNSEQKRSVLKHALDALVQPAAVSPRRAAAMMKFVAVAQSVWVWATVSVRSHADFLTNCLTWLGTLRPPSRSPENAESLHCTNEYAMAAHFCEILAVNLHASLQTGDKTVLRLCAQKLDFLQQHAVSVDAYNRSLHRNLTENLSRKFPACELRHFKRSLANPAPHGRTFYYDLEVASLVLGHEALSWYGDTELRAQSYEAEVSRANINLSLVDAQKRLLESWKQLATVLSEFVDQDAALPCALAKTAEACLLANADANINEPGTADVLQTRAELAFVLLSKIVGIKSADPVMKELLPAAWQLVRTSPVDYDVATAEEDLRYYRTLLQILFLSMKPHCYMSLSTPSRQSQATTVQEEPKPTLSASTVGTLVEIVNMVIVPGFRALCGNLHTDLQMAQPADFALLTALLQTILSVQGIAIAHSQLADAVMSSTVARGALSLYTWADHLADAMPGYDPIYGEIAVHFLLTLSSVPGVGVQMASNGVLAQLSSANISNYFRKSGGKGPFDEPVRMFGIWAAGLLPLCLNLLEAVGPPVAGEVAAFLNSFPQQLARAEDAFKTEVPSYRRKAHNGDVSLGLLREARSLIMIGLVLQSNVARAAAEGINAAEVPLLNYDLGNARAEVEKLSRTQRSLVDKIVATNEREAVWARTLASGSSDTVLQAMVVEEMKRCLALFGE